MQKSLRFIVCFAALLLASFAMQAQAPQKFSYQAVVRNASNALVRNTPVGVRISIFQYTAGGTLKFQETHTPTTNDNGLFTIEIGNGTPGSGNIAIIDWGDGPYFLRCEVDPAGGTSYTLTADQQLLAVPYALHCNEYQDLADIVAKGNHAGMKQLKDVKDPTQAQDAVTKHYLDSVVAIVSALAGARVKDTAASACVSFTWPRTGRTYNTSGIYFDTIKNACGAGCDTVVAMRLTIVDGPAVTLGEITSNVGTSSCAGAEAALTAHVTASNGTLSYLWTRDAGAALQSNNTVAVATEALTAGSNTYTVTVTASVDGCGTADASKNITITASAASAVALNDINSSNGATICIGASTGLSVSPSSNTGTVSYVWSVSPATGGLSATSGDAVTATPTATGDHTYTVVATAHQDGCVDATDTKQITIGVEAQPAVSLGNLTSTNGNTFCVGNTSTTLSLGAGSSEGTVAYAWSATNSATAGLTDANETSRTVEPTAANTYVYTVTATASKAYGGCDNAVDSKSYTVTVNAAPELVLGNIKSNGTAATVDVLNTTSHTLTAVINTPDPLPGSGISYQWYKNGGTMAGQTNSTLDITTAGVYKVRVTYNNGTCSTYQEKEITICETPPTPVIELTAGSATMCAGSSATLAVTAATYNGAYTYTWSPSTGLNTTTGQNVTASPTSTTNYTVTATNSASGCDSYTATSDAYSITVETYSPSVTATASSTSVDAGDNVTLTATPSLDGGTQDAIAWSIISGSGGSLSSTSDNPTTFSASPASSTTYTIQATLTASKGACIGKTATNTVDVTVSPACPSFTGGITSLTASPSSISTSGTSTISGVGSNGSYYSYYDGSMSVVSSNSGYATLSRSTSSQYTFSATQAGTYTIRWTTTFKYNGGCDVIRTRDVDVTVTACSVTLTAINITRTGRASGGECANIPFALTCTPTYTPANATVTYQWKRGGPSSSQPSDYGYSNISSTYALSGATSKICYVRESNGSSTGQTFWYDCEVTVTSGGCSITKTKKQLTSTGLNVGIYSNGGSGTTYTNSTASNQSLSRSGTTLTFGSKTASSTYGYVVWFVVPNDAANSNPAGLFWKTFTASNTSKGSGTATVPSSGGKVYYFNSKSNNTGTSCPTSSGTHQATSIVTTPKTYN